MRIYYIIYNSVTGVTQYFTKKVNGANVEQIRQATQNGHNPNSIDVIGYRQ